METKTEEEKPEDLDAAVLPPQRSGTTASPEQRYYRLNYLARSFASLKVFGSKYAQKRYYRAVGERYYRPYTSGTTARAVLPLRPSGTTA